MSDDARPAGRAFVADLRMLSEAERLDRVADLAPYAKFVGISFRRAEFGPIGVLRFNERNIGDTILPAVHGGVVGAFLEYTAVMQILVEAAPAEMPRPLTTTVAYLRPCGPRDAFAHARIVKRGRNVTNLRVEAWQEREDKPVATAEVHLMSARD